jgi:hypothetical protein
MAGLAYRSEKERRQYAGKTFYAPSEPVDPDERSGSETSAADK